MTTSLYDRIIGELEKTEDFTERLALKLAAGILIQRQPDVLEGRPDHRIALTMEEYEWTPEKLELIYGVIPWPTPEHHAEGYDMLNEYLATDAQGKEKLRELLLNPTKEMRKIMNAKIEAEWPSKAVSE